MTVDHPLAQRFRRARTEVGKSNRKIAEEAGVSPATVDRMMNGEVDAKVENLDKVSLVLRVPVREARELAGLPAGAGGPYMGPAESRLLDDRQRSALDELIRSIVTTTRGATHAVSDSETASTGASSQARQTQKRSDGTKFPRPGTGKRRGAGQDRAKDT